jgi:hypothetical protein
MMLRHIVSVGLAMTACVALIPKKVNAATLTIESSPGGGGSLRQIPAKRGDIIDFIFYLQAEPGNQFVKVKGWEEVQGGGRNPFFDTTELEQVTQVQWQIPLDLPLDLRARRNIATWKLKAKTPVKDTIPDVSALLKYEEQIGFDGDYVLATSPASGSDVIPVPEPLTIFGTAIGLGCGVLFKRKSSKKTVF